MSFIKRFFFLWLALLGALGTLSADTITVTDLSTDVASNSGPCNLREAIDNANNDAQTWSPCAAGSGTDTIVVDATGTLTLTSNLSIGSDLSIVGRGASRTTIDGADLYEFQVPNASTTIGFSGLYLLNMGASTFGAVHLANISGGNNLTFSGVRYGSSVNSLVTWAGSPTNNLTVLDSSIEGVSGAGQSGISNRGTLTIRRSTITGSANNGVAETGGGAVTLENCTIYNNTNVGFFRSAAGTTSIDHCSITGNATGIQQNGSASGATLSNSIVFGNTNNNAGSNPLVSNGSNTILPGTGTLTGGTGDSSSDPLLQAAAFHGGLGLTLALGGGSPALDTANATTSAVIDQAGGARSQGGGRDRGALEAGVIVPAISSLSFNSSAPAGAGGLQIVGTGFTAPLTITVKGVDSASFYINTPTLITADVPANSSGSGAVVITGAGGSSSTGPSSAFTYTGGVPAPAVTGLSFSSAAISGTAGLVITGTDFASPLTVTVNGVDSAGFSIDSATQITAQVPANVAGSGNVVVTSSSGSSSASGSNAFSYAAGSIVVTTLNDTVANDGLCSLREAIDNANADGVNGRNKAGECGGGTGADTILLGSGSISLSTALTITASLTLSGQGAGVSVLDGGNTGGGLVFWNTSTNTVANLTVKNAASASTGAVVAASSGTNLTLSRVSVENAPSNGIVAFGTLSVLDSSVNTSTATQVYFNSAGSLSIRRSTIAHGGKYGVQILGGTALLENSTIADHVNSSTGGQGVYALSGSPVITIDHCTITAFYQYGIVAGNSSGAVFNLKNSVVNGSVVFATNPSILAGQGTTINSLGSNSVGFGHAVVGTGVYNAGSGDDTLIPAMGPLADNGGFAQTRALSAGSSAVDSALASSSVTTDERGVASPKGLHADRGAFELSIPDTTPPTLSFQSPADNSYVASGSAPLWATLSDASGIQAGSVSLTANAAYQSYAFSAGYGSVTRTGAALADGVYAIQLGASDTASNGATASLSFTVDTLTPTASVFPADLSYTNNAGIKVWAQISDLNLDPSALTLTVNGGTGHLYSNGSISSTGSAIVGLNRVTLTAKDRAGNTLSKAWAFTLDTLTPTAAVFPSDLSLTNSALAWAQVSDANVDPSALTLTVNGGNGHLYSNGSISSTGSALTGFNAVTLTAKDKAGNTLTKSWVFTYDGTAPVIGAPSPADLSAGPNALVHVPLSDAHFQDATITVNGASDGFAFDGVTLTRTGSALSEGFYQVTLTARDGTGNAGTLAWVFTFDATAPAVTAGQPAASTSVFTGVPQVSATYSDAVSGINAGSVVLMLDGVTVTSGVSASASQLSFRPASPLAAGVHAVDVFVSDNAANLGHQAWSFTVSDASARYAVGSGRDFGSISAAIAAVQSAETALGGGSFHFPRFIDIAAGSYNESNSLDLGTLGASPTVANPLVIRHAGANVHPIITGNGSGATFSVLVPNVTLDGLDIKNGSAAYENVFVANVSGFVMERCYLETTSSGSLAALDANGTVAPVIKGNAFYSNTLSGYLVYTVCDGLQFTNNTLRSDLPRILASFNASSSAPFTLAANIFADPLGVIAAGQFAEFTNINSVPTAGDRNIYFSGASAGFQFLNDNGTLRDLAGWKGTHTSIDVNSIEADPLLVSGAGAAGLSTQNGSPAIEFANGNTYGLDTDYFGKSRYPDAGFSEYIVSTTTKPVILNPSPASGAINQPTVLTITATLQDLGGSGINQNTVAVTLDGIELLRSTSANFVSAPTGTLATGLHHVSMNMDDNAGNHANQLNFSFVVGPFGQPLTETTAPIISGATPHGPIFSSLPVIFVSVTDGASALASGVSLTTVSLKLDGVVVPATVTAGSSSVDITFTPSSALALGTHAVTLDVNDIAGNSTSTYAWSFSVLAADTTAPVISNPAPAATATGLTGVVLSADYADGGSGIDPSSVVMTLDGVTVPGTATAAAVSFNAPSLSVGTHLVSVDVKDLAGNAAQQLHWAFTAQAADSTAPASDIVSPLGATLNSVTGTVIAASLTDSASGVDVSSIVMTVDGAIVTPTVATAGLVSYSPVSLLPGTHHISVDVKDLAGNAAPQLRWSFDTDNIYCPGLTHTVSFSNISSWAGLNNANHATTDPAGNIYVANAVGGDLRKYDPAGTLLASLPIGGPEGVVYSAFNNSLYVTTRDAVGNIKKVDLALATVNVLATQANPNGIGVDSAGRLYVADSANHVFRYDAAGVALGSWDGAAQGGALFQGTTGVHVDADDDVYVTSFAAGLVQKFSAAGAYLGAINTGGNPHDVTVDSLGDVYVALYTSDRVQRYSAAGALIDSVGSAATVAYGFQSPLGFALSPSGTTLYVVDRGAHNAVSSFSILATDPCAPDSAGPTVGALSPAAGSVTTTASPLITAHLADAAPSSGIASASVKLTVDGAPVAAVTDGVTVSFTAASLSQGNHIIGLDLKDQAGNAAAHTAWSFTVDSDHTAPSFSAFSPVGVTTTGKPVVYASVTDSASGVQAGSVVVRIDGSVVGATLSAATASGIAITYTPAVALSQGDHTVSIDAADKAGNVAAQLNWILNVASDSTLPVVSAASPTSTVGTSSPLITAHLADNGSGIDTASVAMTLDGSHVAAINDGITVSFTAGALADGLHVVSVDVKDLVGNAAVQATWSFTVAADTVKPVITNVAPTGLTLTGTSGTTISASFSDALSGVDLASVSMTVDGEAVPAVVSAGNVKYSPAILGIGNHLVTVDLKDNAGNAAVQAAWTFNSGTLYCSGPPPSTLAFSSAAYFGPTQVIRDSAGNYYVADNALPGIDVYSPGFAYVTSLSLPGPIASMDIDPTDILVLNVNLGASSSIYRMDTAGSVLTGWPVSVAAGATGVATDGAGNVYVANNGDTNPGHKVHKYGPTGSLLLAWGSSGSGNGKFNSLSGITVDSAGAVYVADPGKHRVQKFNGSNGNYIRKWGSLGSGNGQFHTPSGLAASPAGVIFVADSTDERIQAFDLNGIYQSQIGSAGFLNGQFNGLGYIVYDHGLVMTQDSGNNRLQLFTSGGSGLCNSFDTDPPVISGVQPAGGSVLSSTTPLIWAAFSDLTPGSGVDSSSIVATLDGNDAAYTATAASVTVTSGALGDGVHTVTLNVKDFEGNAATQLSWQFTVHSDTTAPVVNSVSAPVAAAPLTVAAGATINVSYGYTEANPAYVSITVRSGAVVIGTRVISAGLLPDASRTDTVALSSTAATGVYDVEVDVVDLSSLTGTATSAAAVVVDATKPLVSATTLPILGANVIDATGSTTIAFYLSDAGGAGLDSASVKLLLDGSFRTPSSVSPDGTGLTLSYTASGLATGIHSATVSFKDLVGNVGLPLTLTFSVQTDVLAPTVTAISYPTTAAPVTVGAGATLNVSYAYLEANPAYISITVRSGANIIGSKVISSGVLPDDTRTDSVALLSSPSASTGVYDVLVSVVDSFGHVGSLTSNASVIVDTTPPTASGIVQPLAASTVIDVNGNTDIAAYLADAGGAGVDPASVKVLLDGSFKTPVVGATGTGYTVTYTASGLATGTHSVTLSYKDLVGNAGADKTWTFNVVRDNTAPVVSAVSAPTTALPITVAAGATISVSYAYTEVNPAYVSITVRSGANVIGATVISSGLLPNDARTDVVALVSSPTAATGVYDVLVTLVDTAGQSGALTANASVVVDNTPPTISATILPVGGSTVIDTAGFTSITAYVADAGGAGIDPASIKLFLDGAFKNGATIGASGTGYSLTFTTGGGNALAAGLHSVSVTYADKVGNVGLQKNWSFTMVRDNTAPVISAITSPTSVTPSYTHASGTVDVLWSYVEANPSWVSITVRSGGTIVGQTVISSGLASAPGAPLAMTTSVDLFDTVAAGAYDVQVTMQDSANQQGTLSSASSVVIDNNKPTASIGAPLAGSINQTSSPVITANLADTGLSGVEVGSIVMRLDGSVVAAATSATLAQYTASNLADGLHTVDVDLNDRANNAATRLSWSFRTDVSVPSISLTAPFDNAYVRGSIPLEALSSDAGSGVTRTAFYQNGSLVGTSFFNGSAWNDGTGLSPSASTRWNTTLVADGAYTIMAKAVDLVGNTATSADRHVVVDNTAPVLTIDPTNSPTQYQAQTITGQLVEQNVASLSVNGIGATLTGTAPNYTWTCVVPLVSGANGVTITTVDLGGLSATALVGITVDPTATVHFIAPLVPAPFKGQVEIEGSAPSTARWMTFEVSRDNVTWNSVSLNASVAGVATTLTKTAVNGWRLSWNTIADGLADGSTYYLRMAAYDQYDVLLGTSKIGPFSTDNVAPVESFSIAPLPDLNGGNAQVYDPAVTIHGSVTETGSGVARLVLEQFNSSGDHVGNSPVDLPVLSDGLFSRNVILIPGYNRLKVTVTDLAGNASSVSSVVYYLPPKSSGTICSSGGSVAAPDHTQILIPDGAFITCQDVSIFTVDRILLANPANPTTVIVGAGHLIKPEALVLQAQATVILPYTNADLDPDANGIPDFVPGNLKVIFWDGTLWQNVGVDSIDTVNQRVSVRTNHLGLFALASDTTPLPSAPKVYLTKNPFRFGTGEPTAFVYDMPQPGKVTIRIFDMTGDPVRVLVDHVSQQKGRFTQVWDGLNNFDRFVGSGAYVYRFEAEYDDGSKTSVTKAIGVLK